MRVITWNHSVWDAPGGQYCFAHAPAAAGPPMVVRAGFLLHLGAPDSCYLDSTVVFVEFLQKASTWFDAKTKQLTLSSWPPTHIPTYPHTHIPARSSTSWGISRMWLGYLFKSHDLVGRVGHRHDARPSHTCCKLVYSLEQTRFTETCAKTKILISNG